MEIERERENVSTGRRGETLLRYIERERSNVSNTEIKRDRMFHWTTQ